MNKTTDKVKVYFGVGVPRGVEAKWDVHIGGPGEARVGLIILRAVFAVTDAALGTPFVSGGDGFEGSVGPGVRDKKI